MKIIRLSESCCGIRFRVVGTPEDKNWTVRDGREPWCELTVSKEIYSSGQETGRLLVTSFGGEVWPSAWPSLFCCSKNAMQSNGSEVTTKGRQLLGV